MTSRLLAIASLLVLVGCPGTTPPECSTASECGDPLPVCHLGVCVACEPASTGACFYGGPAGTEGVGACHAGTHACAADGSGYGGCSGEVLPAAEDCVNGADDDCNGVPDDGASCVCAPGSTRSCYGGADGTAGVGRCTAGTQLCNAEGTGYGACEGELLPTNESCTNSTDDDCDGVLNNPTLCICEPGASSDCYSGAEGTLGNGVCQAGTHQCNAEGTGYGECVGEVVPSADVCGNGLDEDCDGTPDDSLDEDGDGWAICDGDCCDSNRDGCADPVRVNPGAFDFAGDGVDENCNGTPDDGTGVCDEGLASDSSNAADYAKALGVCADAPSSPASERRWGLVSAAIAKPDGSVGPSPLARSLRGTFGAISPQAGASLVVLSTGHAAAPGQTNPVFSTFEGSDTGVRSSPPADWFAANGNQFPNAPGCPAPRGGNTLHDPVMLQLRIRAPTNARSFSLKAFFLSSEFPEWVCSPFSDFFIALLDSQALGNPSDKNLAVYATAGGALYPMGVNLAYGNTGLFTACVNGGTGCVSGGVPGSISTCTSSSELVGTGFDEPQEGMCDSDSLLGGGTGWLQLQGNVVPGETITLRLAIWDTGDATYDSVVLLDGLSWSRDPVQAGAGGN